jgi:hypothetical protein
VNYTYQPPRPEEHLISVWGDDLPEIAEKDEDGDWSLTEEVGDWLDEHDELHNGVRFGDMDFSLCVTISFKTRDAAMLFKLTFGGVTAD